MAEAASTKFLHHDLTSDRLKAVAEVLAAARDSARRIAQIELGDDSWSIGCTCYSRSRHSIVALAATNPWLVVTDPGMEFVFKIGAVPVRFFHGDATNPPLWRVRPTDAEQQLQPGIFERPIEGVHRFVVATDVDGYAAAVDLVRAEPGGARPRWSIWSKATAKVGGEIAPFEAKPLSLELEVEPAGERNVIEAR